MELVLSKSAEKLFSLTRHFAEQVSDSIDSKPNMYLPTYLQIPKDTLYNMKVEGM